MFCIQDNQFVSPAVQGTLEKLNELMDSPRVKWKIETIRSVRKPGAIKQWAGNTDYQKFCLKEAKKKKVGEAFKALSDEEKLVRWATALKESLPCLIFGARDFDETPLKKDPSRKMKRRILAAIHLSGLFMFDVDHVDNPHEIYERTRVDGFPWEVVFAHLTSSGKGLRLVCKARVDVGNIADNQIELAKTLDVKADASCIDASRISYAPMREDVYYLNEEELLNYYDEAFDKKYCETYRSGSTAATDKTHSFDELRVKNEELRVENEDGRSNESEAPSPFGEGGGRGLYHGVEYAKICEAWQAAQGGAPAAGDRHRTMLQMALDLRYICDNQPEVVDHCSYGL